MRDICYLHGFLVRRDGRTEDEHYEAIVAAEPTSEAEETAFAGAVTFIRTHEPCVIYFYSPYERTWWRKLQQKYPSVVDLDQIDAWLGSPIGVDLYGDVVRPHTIWPTHDHSIKTLASFLGFHWRDPDPSGGASIEWYNQWVQTGDSTVKQRILEYNEDDCRATRVLLDGVRRFPVRAR
jgi:predicted RecB family nuclease